MFSSIQDSILRVTIRPNLPVQLQEEREEIKKVVSLPILLASGPLNLLMLDYHHFSSLIMVII